jgi:hypothetical protein
MPGKLIVDEIEDSGGTSVIGRKNYIINGNFDIWQRGTSETGRTSNGYAADRWFINPSGGTIASSQQAFTVGQTDVPNEPGYFYRFTNSVAADNAGIWQKIEGVRSLAGQTATISFYAKYTTNAPTSLNLDINQDFGSSGSADVATSIQTGITLTTSWQKFTYSIDVPSISGKTVAGGDDNISFRIGNPNTEIWDMDIAQVQVEKGSVATDFEVRPIAEELALCQRYYQYSSTGSRYVINGALQSSTDFRCFIPLHIQMRATPTVTLGASPVLVSNGAYDNNGVTLTGNTQIAGGLASAFSCAATAGTFSTFHPASMRINTLEFDAEL